MTNCLPREEMQLILKKTCFHHSEEHLKNTLTLNKENLITNLLTQNSKVQKEKPEISLNNKNINKRWIKNIKDIITKLNSSKKIHFKIIESNLEKIKKYRNLNNLKNKEIKSFMLKQNDLISILNNLFAKIHQYHIDIQIVKKNNKLIAQISFSKILFFKMIVNFLYDKKTIKRVLSLLIIKWIFPDIFCFIKNEVLEYSIDLGVLKNLVFGNFQDFNEFIFYVENEENEIFRKLKEGHFFEEEEIEISEEEEFLENYISVYGEDVNIENLIDLTIGEEEKMKLYEDRNKTSKENLFLFRVKYPKVKKKIKEIKKIELKKDFEIKEEDEGEEKIIVDLVKKFENYKIVKIFLKIKNFEKNSFSLKKIDNLIREAILNFKFENIFINSEKLKFRLNELLLSNFIEENEIFENIFQELKTYFFEQFQNGLIKEEDRLLKLKSRFIRKNNKQIFELFYMENKIAETCFILNDRRLNYLMKLFFLDLLYEKF